MKRLLAFLAIITVVMIIMAIMANTSKASVHTFKGKLTQKEVKAEIKTTLVPVMNHTSADYQMVEYVAGAESKILTTECNLSEATSETVEYSSTTNHIDGVDFETVAY